MRKFMAALTFVVLGSAGGNGSAQQAAVSAGDEGSTSTASGAVHDVEMKLMDDGSYVYSPVELTIKAGDTVRWINVSGGPHNVQFKGALPDGAAAVLANIMPDQMMPMAGPFLMAPNAVYEVTFEGAPAGDYPYVCTPHEMLGMVATLTIE